MNRKHCLRWLNLNKDTDALLQNEFRGPFLQVESTDILDYLKRLKTLQVLVYLGLEGLAVHVHRDSDNAFFIFYFLDLAREEDRVNML